MPEAQECLLSVLRPSGGHNARHGGRRSRPDTMKVSNTFTRKPTKDGRRPRTVRNSATDWCELRMQRVTKTTSKMSNVMKTAIVLLGYT